VRTVRVFFLTGALLAGLAVVIGAATGHETSTLDELARSWIAKGSRYQFLHGLSLISVAVALGLWPDQRRLLSLAGGLFIAGTLLFSGSLYFMAVTGVSAGYVTPLGGLCFLAGWLAMALAGGRLGPPRPK